MINQDTIIDDVLLEFTAISQIPRPSKCEQAISDYLKGVFENLGATTIQDSSNNLIADLPSTPGLEELPIIAFQAHMDMVCIGDGSTEYNPKTDAISLLRDDSTLTANGTSLGADDGIGIAMIIYLFKNLAQHGRLRAIITTDEEAGMSGANNLAAEYVADVKYLINCDSEEYDVVTIGCAGSAPMKFTKELVRENATTAALKIELFGFAGGHSGIDIGKSRANAIKLIANFLLYLREQGLTYRLSSITGGRVPNAIAATAAAIITTSLPPSTIEEYLQDYLAETSVTYREEHAIDYRLREEKAAPLSQECENSILTLITTLPSGVLGLNAANTVETSANLGLVVNTENSISLDYLPRSSFDSKLLEIIRINKLLAASLGFKLAITEPSPGWKENIDSVLLPLMTDIFYQQNGIPMQVENIHAGLECGYLARKNPNLDIVSIGPTVLDIHTPDETLILETIPVQINLLVALLDALIEIHSA